MYHEFYMKQVPHKQLNNRKRAAPIQEVQFVLKGGEYGQCGTSSKCWLNSSCRLAGRIGKKPVLVCPGGKSAGLEHVPSVFHSLDIRKFRSKTCLKLTLFSHIPLVHPFVSCDSIRNFGSRKKKPNRNFNRKNEWATLIHFEMKVSTQSYLTLAVLLPVILLIHPYIAAKETTSKKNLLAEDHFHLGADFEAEFSSMENQIAVMAINNTSSANSTGKI